METTREERLKKVLDALAVGSIDAPMPDDYTMSLFQKYIDGELDLDEIEEKILKHFRPK